MPLPRTGIVGNHRGVASNPAEPITSTHLQVGKDGLCDFDRMTLAEVCFMASCFDNERVATHGVRVDAIRYRNPIGYTPFGMFSALRFIVFGRSLCACDVGIRNEGPPYEESNGRNAETQATGH